MEIFLVIVAVKLLSFSTIISAVAAFIVRRASLQTVLIVGAIITVCDVVLDSLVLCATQPTCRGPFVDSEGLAAEIVACGLQFSFFIAAYYGEKRKTGAAV